MSEFSSQLNSLFSVFYSWLRVAQIIFAWKSNQSKCQWPNTVHNVIWICTFGIVFAQYNLTYVDAVTIYGAHDTPVCELFP